MTLAERMADVLAKQKAYQEALADLVAAIQVEQLQTGTLATSLPPGKRLSEVILERMEPGKAHSLDEIAALAGVEVDGRLRTNVSRLKKAKKLVQTGDATYRRA
jgi:hypothetical protein